MSLLGQVQARPGNRVGRTVDEFPKSFGVSDDDDDAPRQHPSRVSDPFCETVQLGDPPQIKKIQSRESKTACFVFCSFRFLTQGTMSSGSRDLSATGPPSV